jgi:hypothetical protein
MCLGCRALLLIKKTIKERLGPFLGGWQYIDTPEETGFSTR